MPLNTENSQHVVFSFFFYVDLNLMFCYVCMLFFFLHDAGSSVIVHDDPTSRGPTTAAANTTAANPQSAAAPSPAPATESTHVTPGNVCFENLSRQTVPTFSTCLVLLTQISTTFLQQQIQEVFKNQQEQLNIQLLQQKNAGIVSQEVIFFYCSIMFLSLHEGRSVSELEISLIQYSTTEG